MNWLKGKVRVIQKYLPDFFVFVGVFLFSINYFQEKKVLCIASPFQDCTQPDWGIITGIMVIFVGLNLLVRRYFLKS